jgi:hypothetical protein
MEVSRHPDSSLALTRQRIQDEVSSVSLAPPDEAIVAGRAETVGVWQFTQWST